jgi:hypothetical protein
MDAQVVRQLWMECGRKESPLTSHHGTLINFRYNLTFTPCPKNQGSTDEDAREGNFKSLNVKWPLERFFLSSEGIAADFHIHGRKQRDFGWVRKLFRQKDTPSARPENPDIVILDSVTELVTNAALLQDPGYRRTLTAREDNTVKTLYLFFDPQRHYPSM